MSSQPEEKFIVLKGVNTSVSADTESRTAAAEGGVAFQNASGGLRRVTLGEVKTLARESAERLLAFYHA